ncbi:MAG: alpha-galactosidase [Bryobacteraceae bacterium]
MCSVVSRVTAAALLMCSGMFAANVQLKKSSSGFRAENGTIAVEASRGLGLRVFLKNGEGWTTLSSLRSATAVSLRRENAPLEVFRLSSVSEQLGVMTPYGSAGRVSVKAARGALDLLLTLDFPDRYPDLTVLTSTFQNQGKSPITVAEVNQAALDLVAKSAPNTDLFWSLQGGGYKWGADFIFPVRAGFKQDNYTGPKGNGNGGGFPMVDLWRPEMGLAVALLDPKPALAWVPVEVSETGVASVRVTIRPSVKIVTGAAYAPPPVMIAAHHGDFYQPMVRYRELMDDLGVHVVKEYEPDDFAPAYCTWGYERKFTMKEVLAKVPQMQEMGMTDFILDDGWFDLFGNWRPNDKFPNGVEDMQAAISTVHAAGKKFRLWWSPGSADPGSDIDLQHPDWFILDRSGKREKASWNAYYLCPAYSPVRESTMDLVRRFVLEWRVDAFKSDGTDLNHAPLCFNPAHHHARPEESFEQWPELMKSVRDEARRLKPGFRVELCPCGITPTFQLATATEQPTDSDPYVQQVTLRTKFLKAMFGPHSPVLQEYVGVEVYRAPDKPSGVDIYPRAMGTGEVLSTFTTSLGTNNARWTEIYNRYRPAEGEYLNLYDIGWEPVEGHAIRKGAKLYYGFFSRRPGDDYSGKVELRGLETGRRYRVTDYANGKSFSEVAGPAGSLETSFRDSLLLVAEPM